MMPSPKRIPWRLTEADLERLREACDEGAGDACRALRELTGLPLALSTPRALELRLHEVQALLGGTEAEVAALRLAVRGGSRGAMLIAFDRASARRVAGAMVSARPAKAALQEIHRSALMELGNIVAGAYLGGLGRRLGETLIPSVPELALDMAGAVAEALFVELAEGHDAAIVVRTDLSAPAGPHQAIQGRILLLPDPATLPSNRDELRADPDGRDR